MRNLARYAVGTSPTPPAYLVDFFTKNAAAVWCNRIPEDPHTFNFSFNWNWRVPGYEPKVLSVDGRSQALCDLITQVAGQDALNAAVRFTPDAAIVCLVKSLAAVPGGAAPTARRSRGGRLASPWLR